MEGADLPQLHFIIDTNLVLQCKPLKELDWSEWRDFEEVHLIVCRPVLRELDAHKYNPRNRISGRSRDFLSLISPLIEGPEESLLIKENNPPVKLFVAPEHRAKRSLSEELDYSKSDDELIGCIQTYIDKNPSVKTRLLTHDSGPIITARSYGLQFKRVPDDWLLPAENDEISRENKKLMAEIRQLKTREPVFKVGLKDQSKSAQTLEFEHCSYREMSRSDINKLTHILKNKFPLQLDVNSKDNCAKNARSDLVGVPLKVSSLFTTTPPTEKDIKIYSRQEYPNWIKECESIFQRLPERLNLSLPSIKFSFFVRNEGNQTAKSALIIITAKGNFRIQIVRQKTGSNHLDMSEKKEIFELPLPPKPPVARSSLERSSSFQDTLKALTSGEFVVRQDPLDLREGSKPQKRRYSDELFYMNGHLDTPVSTFTLGCDQLRHGFDDCLIHGELCLDDSCKKHEGVLEIQLHAENLPEHLTKHIKVRGITTSKSSVGKGLDLITSLDRRWIKAG